MIRVEGKRLSCRIHDTAALICGLVGHVIHRASDSAYTLQGVAISPGERVLLVRVVSRCVDNTRIIFSGGAGTVPVYVELPVDDEGCIKVEVSDPGVVRAGAGDVIGKATERFDDAIAQVIRMGQLAIRRATMAATPPDAIDVELGLKLTAKTGFVIAESSGEANFKVVLKWTLTDAEQT